MLRDARWFISSEVRVRGIKLFSIGGCSCFMFVSGLLAGMLL